MNELTKKHLLSKGFFETDENQMVKKLSETKFHVYDEVEYPFGVYAFDEVVDLEDYTEEQLEKEISGYYFNLKEMRAMCEDGTNQYITEIIAENSDHNKFVSK